MIGALVAVGLLGSCGSPEGAGGAEGTPPGEVAPVETPPTADLPPDPAPGDTISGVVWRDSDVETIPDQPFESVWVLAVPLAAEARLWREAGFGAAGPERASHAGFAVPLGMARNLGALATTDLEGRFALPVEPGAYLLCVGTGQESFEALGCDQARISDGSALTMTVGRLGVRVTAA